MPGSSISFFRKKQALDISIQGSVPSKTKPIFKMEKMLMSIRKELYYY